MIRKTITFFATTTILLFFLISLKACDTTNVSGINLVPETPAKSANYWCTWYAQNYWIQRGGALTDLNKITNPAAREELSYHHLFNNKEGWITNYLPKGRSDWFFLIDHGWQNKGMRRGGRCHSGQESDYARPTRDVRDQARVAGRQGS